MTLAAALYAHLTGTVGLAALVGTRVYPVQAPQADENAAIQPFVAYALVDRVFEYPMGAKVMTMDTWSFVAVASTYDDAHAVNDALIAALDRYRGTMGGAGGVSVQTATILGSKDLLDEAELGLYLVGTQFEIVY